MNFGCTGGPLCPPVEPRADTGVGPYNLIHRAIITITPTNFIDKTLSIRYYLAKKHMKKDKSIKSLEKILGYRFKNHKKLIQALTHSSYKNEFIHGLRKGTLLDRSDNERMEFFGDAILSFAISKKLFQTFPKEDEGVLSKYRSLLVSKKSLFTIAKKIKLHHYIRLGKSENQIKLKEKAKITADSFEAVIAAIYLDGGIGAAEKFITKQFKPYLDIKKLKLTDSKENYKSILQETTQKEHHLLPRYKTILKNDAFTATIYFKNKSIGSAKGKSKREAEKNAAKAALQWYKKKFKKKR